MQKHEILIQIEDLTAEQLFEYIQNGHVTLDDLRNSGNLDATKRKAITSIKLRRDHEEDIDWQKYKDTDHGCKTYLDLYPLGRYLKEARQVIDDIERKGQANLIRKREILERIQHNPNSYSASEIKKYLNAGTISRNDLESSGIPNSIIDRLDNIVSPDLTFLGVTPDSIPDGYTEVYFWGIPGSGKTCVLSAILSTAEKKGYLEIAQSPGYDYMTRLKNIFVDPISTLPGRTGDFTQYLPFVLKKEGEYPRSVSLIELSGEIFRCFYYKNANIPLRSPQHVETLNTLLHFLSGPNRKIHFFFIDFERENNLDIDGYRQGDYLQAAATYFQNNDIFSNSTDAIYLVVTKSDLIASESNAVLSNLSEYLHDANYTALINSLKYRCKEHSINAGKLLATHFSLGNVYFNNICLFDNNTSQNIIDILIRRIAPNRKSILDVFNQ